MTIQLNFEETKQRELMKLLEKLKGMGWVSSYKLEKSAPGTMENFPDLDETEIDKQIDALIPSEAKPLSDVAKAALKKVDSFKNLKSGWDGYGADMVSDTSVVAAKQFIQKADRDGMSVYFTAPGPNGEVLVEFKAQERSAEIYFESDGQAEALFYENNECVAEGSPIENYEKLISFIHANRD